MTNDRPGLAGGQLGGHHGRPVLDVLVSVVLPVLLVAVVGGVVGRRLDFSVETFSAAVFYLFSPALIFANVATVQLAGGDIARLCLVAIVVFVVNVVVAYAWSRARGSDRPTTAAAAINACVVNQGNMGLPMARLAFGEVGLSIATVIFVFGTFLWSSAGIAIGSMATGNRRAALTAPFRYPSMYAALLGALVNVANIDLPTLLDESITTLAAASIPCMLVVLGLQYRRPRLDDLAEPLAASVNRLLIGPLVAWPAVMLLGLDGVTGRTSVMMAGMPTAVMATVLTSQLGARPDLAVRAVVLSTLLSTVTLTVLITLLR